MTIETTILDSIENGILVTDSELNIHFWNKWLASFTGIKKDTALKKNLEDLYPDTSFKLLKRKIKIALRLKSSSFLNSAVDQFVLPIELKKVTKFRFKHMRQDVVITPLDEKKVSVVIYDNTALLEAKAQIDEQIEILHRQATTDPLTGCYNRKMFSDQLQNETARSTRHGETYSVVIFDIDDFKSVNDLYGHPAGDQVLINIANLVHENLRKSDIFARWGGEEFIMLLPETNLQGAAVLADKIRHIISTHDCGPPGCKTCSFGVVEFIQDETTEELINYADRALYFAKNNGKNQVAIFNNKDIEKWNGIY